MDNTKAYELSRHSDYMTDREKYLIYKAGYDTFLLFDDPYDALYYYT